MRRVLISVSACSLLVLLAALLFIKGKLGSSTSYMHPAPAVETQSGRTPFAELSPYWASRYAVARQLLTAGRLHEAQGEYLQILLAFGPNNREALDGLIAVRKRLAQGDPAVLRQQAEAYQVAVTEKRETEEHLTLRAMTLLAAVCAQAASQIEAEQGLSRATRRPATAKTSFPSANGSTGQGATTPSKPVSPQPAETMSQPPAPTTAHPPAAQEPDKPPEGNGPQSTPHKPIDSVKTPSGGAQFSTPNGGSGNPVHAGETQTVPAKVDRITSTEAGTELRVIIGASGLVTYQLVRVRPDWIVLDILGAELGMPTGPLQLAKAPLEQVRIGQHAPNVVRVVLELSRPMQFRVSAAPDGRTIVVSILERPTGGAQSGGDLQKQVGEP